MVDMTGGVGEVFELRDYIKIEEDKFKLFKIFRKCKEYYFFISVVISVIFEKLLFFENDGDFFFIVIRY